MLAMQNDASTDYSGFDPTVGFKHARIIRAGERTKLDGCCKADKCPHINR
jgi:hypothetical protein